MQLKYYYKKDYNFHDQSVFNFLYYTILIPYHNLIHILDYKLFPNGYVYYNKLNDKKPYIIHFNYTYEKKKLMKKYNMWFIK